MMRALDDIRDQGGEVLCGGDRLNTGPCFVAPTLVRSHERMPIVKEEIFAPILHLIEFERIGEAISGITTFRKGFRRRFLRII